MEEQDQSGRAQQEKQGGGPALFKQHEKPLLRASRTFPLARRKENPTRLRGTRLKSGCWGLVRSSAASIPRAPAGQAFCRPHRLQLIAGCSGAALPPTTARPNRNCQAPRLPLFALGASVCLFRPPEQTRRDAPRGKMLSLELHFAAHRASVFHLFR